MNDTPPSATTLLLAREELDRAPGPDFCRDLSARYDDYFSARLGEIDTPRKPFAVVAVGGYGRSELCARSDIDAIILYAKRVPDEAKELAKALFFPLWDLGADLGHGVRSTDECLKLSKKDWQVFASLLDARFLCGDRAVFDDFVRLRDRKLLPKSALPFKHWLDDQNARRASTHGDASGMLEPNLKEGLGGLRDIHQLRWLQDLTVREGGEGLPPQDLDVLEGNLRFLFAVRNRLHLLRGRKEDRLILDIQPELARVMGFTDSGAILAVEVFMAQLHRVMAEIRTLHRAAWPLLAPERGWRAVAERALSGNVVLAREGLDFRGLRDGAAAPADVLDIFGHAVRLGQPLSLFARRALEAGIGPFTRFAATAEGATRAFDMLLRALEQPGSESALTDMLETGVIGAILPEFGRVQDMVQYDVFHIHPVGRHTLETIFELKGAARAEHPYHHVYARIAQPRTLLLGALFHDMGKGLGGSHSEKGMDIAAEALARVGLDEETISEVAFLVLRHLQLADTAVRRDISDRDVLAACAQRVGTTDRLDMLLLLTMADSRATGPSAWNDWKGSLLEELCRRVRSVLEGGRLFDPTDAQHMLALRDRLHRKAKDLFPPELLEARLDAMPPRYLLSRDPQAILGDLRLLARLDADLEEDFRMRPSSVAGKGVAAIETVAAHGGDGWSVTLAARRQPGLFAAMAGVLALHDVNIRSADFFLWPDGTEIHAYQTANPPHILDPEELWGRVRRAVRYALTGKLSLDYRIQEKRASPFTIRPPDMGIRPAVRVDNDSSEYFTRIEVRAGDRIGLLYDMAVVLDTLGLEVHMAKIDTHGLEVFDAFFVRGAKGRKLADTSQLEALERLLLAGIS